MSKQPRFMKLLLTLVATAAVLAFFMPMAFSVESGAMIEEISNTFFENPERPSVPFEHDAHNELAGIGEYENCVVCHHYGDGCELEEGATSEGIPCADCHFENGNEDCPDMPNLMDAYHLQCWGCHEDQGGPVMCGECHVRK